MNKVFDHPKFLATGKAKLSALFDCVFVIIGDIQIISKFALTEEHVNTVMEVLRQHLTLFKQSVCLWGQTKVPNVGHIVSKDDDESPCVLSCAMGQPC